MPWFERITEAAWFKRAYRPDTWLGGMIAKRVGAVLLISSVGVGGYVAAQHDAGDPGVCDKRPLRGVYRPERFRVVRRCETLRVTVVKASKERDGDYHISAIPEDEGLFDLKGWRVNRERQHGYLVLEWVPGDPRPDRFRTGQEMDVLTTVVEDLQHGPKALPGERRHGWIEAHPIFSYELVEAGTGPVEKAPPIPGEREPERNDPR